MAPVLSDSFATALAAPFATDVAEKRFRIVHGRAEDSIRLALHPHHSRSCRSLRTRLIRMTEFAAVVRAAACYHLRVPVIGARNGFQLRLATESEQPTSLHGIGRFGEVFGPGDREVGRVVPRTVMAALEGTAVPNADGPLRDFVYVRDAARALLATAENVGTTGQSLDLTFRSGWEYSEAEMAERVTRLLAGHAPLSQPEPPANPVGWRPKTSLANALEQTIGWYRESMMRTGTSPHAVPRRRAA